MALPKSLVNQANANVSQALQTGARGQTVTNTDYGVIGDAFFKKAQLDLNIANLNADMGFKKASLLSGIEMQKADLEMQSGQLRMNAQQMDEEQRRYEESQEVSDSESLMGALGGAASGAMAGATVGSVVPGIGTVVGAIGGAVIGGVTTYGSYKSGGRAAGQQAQQTLGGIASLSTSFKGLMNEQVKQDAWTGIAKTGGDLIAQFNSAKTPEEQYTAQQALDSHIGEVYNTAMSMPGANPEQAATATAQYRKGLEASVGMSSDQAKRQSNMAQLENLVEFRADSRADDPKQQRAWAMDYVKSSNAIYEEQTGKQMPIGTMIRQAYKLSPEAGQMIENEVTGGASLGTMPAAQARQAPASTASPSARPMATQAAVNTSQGANTVSRQAPPQSSPEPFSNGGIPYAGPMRPSGPGVEMDDGGSADYTPVGSEQKLAEQGGEAVKVIAKTEQPAQKMSMMDKIKHNLSLKDDEFGEKKIPLWEDHDVEVTKPDGTVKKVGSYEQFREDNAAIDMQIKKAAGAGTEEAVRAKGATKVVDRMIKIVEDESYPAGSQLKGIGSKIYNDGVDVGGMAGAAVGAAVTKGTAQGIAAGAFLGSQTEMKVGEGMGPFLDEDEEFAVSEMEKYKQAATMKFAKIQDPTGKISDADAKRFENLWPRPGQTREQQLAGLLTVKEMMLDEMSGAMEGAEAERMGKLKKKQAEADITTRAMAERARNKPAKAPKPYKTANDFLYIGPGR